jgi:hypothetical protein
MRQQSPHWSERSKIGFAPSGMPASFPRESPGRGPRRKFLVIGAAVVCVAVIAGAFLLLTNSGKGTASAPQATAPLTASQLSTELRSLLDRQCRFLDNSDVDGYMSTIDKSSPAYATSRSIEQQTLTMLKDDKLDFSVESFQLLTTSATEATARAAIVTKKVSGSAPFVDNRITAVHTFKKSGGTWLLYGTKIENLEYLQ